MASELNNAFIPGVGAVQAEVARPRTKPVVGTEQGWSEAGSDTSAHLLRAAVPKMQAAPMESAFSPPAAPMECVLPPRAPMESVLPKAAAAAAPMESVMPKAGAPMESVMPKAAPMESVLPDSVDAAGDLVEDGCADEVEEIGDEELQRFFAEHAATSPVTEGDCSRSRSRSSFSVSGSRSRTRSRHLITITAAEIEREEKEIAVAAEEEGSVATPPIVRNKGMCARLLSTPKPTPV